MPALAELTAVTLDCADPGALATFYSKATGRQIALSDGDVATLGDDGPVQLVFQRVEGYRPPQWPDAGTHAHLDLTVTDLEGAAAELVGLGASRPAFQPGDGAWIVLTDPAGHPFCLTTAN